MAKFAPVYMSVYDGPEGALVDLALSAATFVAGAAEDTAIGTLSGMMTDSALSLFNDAGGAVKLVGSNLVVGATATPEAGNINITVRETNEYGSNSPHDTAFVITVTGA